MILKAVIFDMDGLILDSEPLWEETYVERLVALGVPRSEITKPEHKGRGARNFFTFWYTNYPWGALPTVEELSNETISKMELLIKQKAVALPGVIDAIQRIKRLNVPMAIASSSPMYLIELTTKKLGIGGYFDFYHSGSTEDFAKPHPAVFMHTANEMGVACLNCLVFEDSLSGVIAAKAAQMKCIAVPTKKYLTDPRYCIADALIPSMEAFKFSMIEAL